MEFLNFAEKFISPIAGKVASNKHLQIIAASFMSILPIIMIGSFALIVSAPFLDYTTMDPSNFFYGFFKAWADFSTGFGNDLNFLFNVTLGSQGLWIAIAIAYVTAKRRDLHLLNSIIVVFVSFLIVNGELIDWNWSSAYFGGTGLFSSIIVSFLAIDLYTYLSNKNLGLSNSQTAFRKYYLLRLEHWFLWQPSSCSCQSFDSYLIQ